MHGGTGSPRRGPSPAGAPTPGALPPPAAPAVATAVPAAGTLWATWCRHQPSGPSFARGPGLPWPCRWPFAHSAGRVCSAYRVFVDHALGELRRFRLAMRRGGSYQAVLMAPCLKYCLSFYVSCVLLTLRRAIVKSRMLRRVRPWAPLCHCGRGTSHLVLRKHAEADRRTPGKFHSGQVPMMCSERRRLRGHGPQDARLCCARYAHQILLSSSCRPVSSTAAMC